MDVEKPRKLKTRLSAGGQRELAWGVPRMVTVVDRMTVKWFASLRLVWAAGLKTQL